MTSEQKDEKSPELRAFEAVLNEYKASREENFGLNLKRRSRAKNAFTEAQKAYIQSLPDGYFSKNENIEDFIQLSKKISAKGVTGFLGFVYNSLMGTGRVACLQLEAVGKHYPKLNLDRDILKLKEDLYKLEELKNNYRFIVKMKGSHWSESERLKKLEDCEKKISPLLEEIEKNIADNPQNVSRKDRKKFEEISKQYLEEKTKEKKQSARVQTSLCERDLGTLAQSPKQREGSRSALSRQSSSSSIDSAHTPLLAAEGGARHSSSRVGRKTRQKL